MITKISSKTDLEGVCSCSSSSTSLMLSMLSFLAGSAISFVSDGDFSKFRGTLVSVKTRGRVPRRFSFIVLKTTRLVLVPIGCPSYLMEAYAVSSDAKLLVENFETVMCVFLFYVDCEFRFGIPFNSLS